MLVSESDTLGTIGGGRLEWDATAAARAMLAGGESRRELSIALGPEIGQCCGGRVDIVITRADESALSALDADRHQAMAVRPAVLIYGAGHVGRAVAQAMALLPFNVSLIDNRQSELDLCHAAGVAKLRLDNPSEIAANAPDRAAHLVMTHSHALDSLVAATVIETGTFRYLGIIGSRTKRNTFLSAFRAMGLPDGQLARIVCPIGGSSVKDKRPEVIAALAAAEITQALLENSETGGLVGDEGFEPSTY